MKLKYYIRGIGIGIIFSTMIFIVAINTLEPSMSKEQIIEEAKKYGMIEGNKLLNEDNITLDQLIKSNDKDTEVEDTKVEDTEIEATEVEATKVEDTEVEATEVEDTEIEDTEVEATEVEDTEIEDTEVEATKVKATEVEATEVEATEVEDTKVEDTEVEATEVEDTEVEDTEVSKTVAIHVISGMNSFDVAKLCHNAGLVDDARDFDKFLTSNGYSRRIKTGTFHIGFDLTYEDMAKILTRV